MVRASVAEEVNVELDRFKVQPFFNGLLLEHLGAVLALGPCGDLDAIGDQVITAGEGSSPSRRIW